MTQTLKTTPPGPAFALDRYVLTGRIACGGMATVYRARIQSAGVTREFAIKVLHPHLADAANVRLRFVDEARIASRIEHPNVVSTVDVGSCRGYHYLVLELIHGVTLRQLQVHRPHCPRLVSSDAARIVADAARGLHAVHTARDEEGHPLRVVHRDVSPHNLMLDTRGRTVLIDLGLSKSEGQTCHTETGILCGKLPYMSPEQSLLQPLDARSDIFSLGSVLFELCTGAPPFGEAHAAETLDALRTCDSARLRSELEACGVADWVVDVTLRCLARDPDDRFASALDVAEALERPIGEESLEHLDLRHRLAALALEAKLSVQPANSSASDEVEPLPCIALPTPGIVAANTKSTAPALRPAPTASPDAVASPASPRGKTQPWIDGARWVALGAALAVVLVTGTRILGGHEAETDGQRPLAAGLAADTATRNRTELAEIHVPPTEAAGNTGDVDAEMDTDSATGDDLAELELEAKRAAAKRARRRVLRRRPKVAHKLRGNPYQD
ncbi:MAG: serine/threonine protein kinase [Myxococcales bacterium FL481]|nr:MAG: serine/threonine protein kinase [Myxococcales bacterium FL481]